MESQEEKLKTRMMKEAEARIERLVARKKSAEEIKLTEIEQWVIEARQEIGERLTQIMVEESAQEQMVPGPNCEKCGKEMHYKGEREKRVLTQMGEVRIGRPYYYCETCKDGIFPPG